MKKLSVSLAHQESFWGWIYLPVQLIALPVLLELFNMIAGEPFSVTELNFIFFCINFICITVIFRKFLITNAKVFLIQPWRGLRSAALGLTLYWLLSYASGLLIYFVDPEFANVNDASINTMVQENYTLMAIGTVLLVPVAEEVLYRGLIFSTLQQRNRPLAYCVSTAAFAALHVMGYIGYFPPVQLLLCFLQYIPAGLSLAWAYERADSIWAPILMHITVNQLAIFAMR